MGPLVPDIISNDLNFIVALLIGIVFGIILEQAGFSTSKKLVGLFYGYDFTVLRVFFTAGVVAMVGLMIFNYYGLIDINLIYINPTFLWSALIGGVIMGLGFILGGFCPGTSVCAAAIGKIDAMIFIAGSFIGVLIFAEGYPLIEGLYKAEDWGNPRIFELMGISQNLFALMMTAMAIFAFIFVAKIEDRVNGIKAEKLSFKPYYITLASIAFVILLSAFFVPDRQEHYLKLVEDESFVSSYKIEEMTSDELAYRLMNPYEKEIQIIDFRNEEDFKKFNLPKSTLFTLNNLFEKEPNKILNIKQKINVIVAKNDIETRRKAIIAKELGYKRIVVLKGGISDFVENIINFDIDKNENLDKVVAGFRAKASKEIPILIANSKPSAPVKKTQKRVMGGC